MSNENEHIWADFEDVVANIGQFQLHDYIFWYDKDGGWHAKWESTTVSGFSEFIYAWEAIRYEENRTSHYE
jgi:hypothetical protein